MQTMHHSRHSIQDSLHKALDMEKNNSIRMAYFHTPFLYPIIMIWDSVHYGLGIRTISSFSFNSHINHALLNAIYTAK